MSGAVTANSLTGRHIKAVRRFARANDKKTLLRACDRAARRGPGGDLNFGAMRTVAAAWNRLDAGGFFGPPSRPTSGRAAGEFSLEGIEDGDPDSVEAGESDALIERAHHAHLARGAAHTPGTLQRLDLDAIEHLAVLSPGGGPTRALVRRVRELEAKMRATGATLANFVGEDADEGRELAALSRELIEVADAGTRP